MQAKNFQMSMLGLEKESNTHWIIEKAREFEKSIYLYFTDYTKAFDCVDHDKLWKALKEMGIPDHLTCLLRNLYTGQETEAEAPILWPPDVKSQLIRKDPDTGED